MNDLNFLGDYGSISEVWAKYPNGALAGDYVNVGGVRYVWSRYERQWRRDGDFTESTARRNKVYHSDVTIDNNLTVSGTIRARGLKQPNCGLFGSEDALKAAYPNPEPGMWACVGNAIPAAIYRCDKAGEWTATGGLGGMDSTSVDGLDEAMEMAGLAYSGATARFSEIVSGVTIIDGEAPDNEGPAIVAWDDAAKLFLLDQGGNFYRKWYGRELYYKGDAVRGDKLYIYEDKVCAFVEGALVRVSENIFTTLKGKGYTGTDDRLYEQLLYMLNAVHNTVLCFDKIDGTDVANITYIDGSRPGATNAINYIVFDKNTMKFYDALYSNNLITGETSATFYTEFRNKERYFASGAVRTDCLYLSADNKLYRAGALGMLNEAVFTKEQYDAIKANIAAHDEDILRIDAEIAASQDDASRLSARVAALEDATVGMIVAAVAGWIDESGAECESDGSDVGDGGHHVSVSCLRTGFIRLCDGSFTFTSPGGTQLVVVKYNGNTLAERIVCEGNSWAVRYSEGMLEIGEVVFNRVRLCYKRGAVAGVIDNITIAAKASAIATLTERNKAGVVELEELRTYAEGNHGDIATLTERLRDAESHIRLHCEQIAAMRPVKITEEELETLTAEEGRLYFIPEEE